MIWPPRSVRIDENAVVVQQVFRLARYALSVDRRMLQQPDFIGRILRARGGKVLHRLPCGKIVQQAGMPDFIVRTICYGRRPGSGVREYMMNKSRDFQNLDLLKYHYHQWMIAQFLV